MTKEAQVLRRATELARTVETWADFSNALYNADDGLLTRGFPTREQRRAFMKTTEYQKICDLLEHLIETTGLVAGATPRKSGKFVVRLPQSLHAALEREAEYEGVSLNQLVVAKLSAQLSVLTAPKRRPASAKR